MSREWYVFWAILTMAGVTYLIRLFPFLVFGRTEKPPEFVLYIGRVISPAAIAMLVVYCMKDISCFSMPFALPEILASSVVILLHLWRNNPLLSILAGTILFMVLQQKVF